MLDEFRTLKTNKILASSRLIKYSLVMLGLYCAPSEDGVCKFISVNVNCTFEIWPSIRTTLPPRAPWGGATSPALNKDVTWNKEVQSSFLYLDLTPSSYRRQRWTLSMTKTYHMTPYSTSSWNPPWQHSKTHLLIAKKTQSTWSY